MYININRYVILIYTGDFVSNRRVIQEYYNDIAGLADLLSKLSNSYRLLVAGAGELNVIALANKKDVRKAIKRANELGRVIDDLIKVLEVSDTGYLDYLQLKNEIISARIQVQTIEAEINEQARFKE